MSSGEAAQAGLNRGETDRPTHDRVEHDVFGFWVFLMSDTVIFAAFRHLRRDAARHRGRPGPTGGLQDRPCLYRNADPADQQFHLLRGFDRDEARQDHALSDGEAGVHAAPRPRIL